MTQTMKKGFSLIELLVVVAIIGVLAAVGIVGYQKYIDSAKKNATISNTDNIFKALSAASAARSGSLPASPDDCGNNNSTKFSTSDGGACVIAIVKNHKNPYSATESAVKVVSTSDANLNATNNCDSTSTNNLGKTLIATSAPGTAAYSSGLNISIAACYDEGSGPTLGPLKVVNGF